MPVYNEEAVLDETIQVVQKKILDIAGKGLVSADSFMMFVDDGSRDSSWSIIRHAHMDMPELVRGMRFAANRGKEYALFAGVMVVRKHVDAIICMDADLQFDLGAIEQFLAIHAKGYELVYGIKKTRGSELFYKRIFAKVFYSAMEFLGSPIVRNHTDYCLLTQNVCNALAEYGETNIIFRGLLKQLGFKQAPCYFEVKDRTVGESHFSLVKLINLSLDAIASFSVAPLRLIVFMGFMVLLIGIAMIVWTVMDAFRGITPGGYATLACSLWFLGGLGMMCLGVVGEYLGKLYMEAKKRPRYHVAETLFE